jgi:phage-related protein
LGFFDGTNLVVLDYAFQKKTQKTPKNAIKTAEERKRDYFKRRMGNE